MTYRERRKKARQKQTLQGAILITAMILFAMMLFPFFSWLDCYNAQKFAAAYEACIEDEACMPSARQHWVYEREGFRFKMCEQ